MSKIVTWLGLLTAIFTALCNAAVPGPYNFAIPNGVKQLAIANTEKTATNKKANPNAALLAPLQKR